MQNSMHCIRCCLLVVGSLFLASTSFADLILVCAECRTIDSNDYSDFGCWDDCDSFHSTEPPTYFDTGGGVLVEYKSIKTVAGTVRTCISDNTTNGVDCIKYDTDQVCATFNYYSGFNCTGVIVNPTQFDVYVDNDCSTDPNGCPGGGPPPL
ncbi:hypothetical protein MFFC18_39910 [Mariniblastus fucicola]|uniref:Uncharacterized protein n=1 Tax=Mariniblastus fucicola TaxID=980251 RepID=A0A5B9PFV2_9BACT|nr:hypothetical protein MFFC18_39910 [Mariniblastus fucicola]